MKDSETGQGRKSVLSSHAVAQLRGSYFMVAIGMALLLRVSSDGCSCTGQVSLIHASRSSF